MKKSLNMIIVFTLLIISSTAYAQLPLQVGDALISGRYNAAISNTVLYLFRAGNTSGAPMDGHVWTGTYPGATPKPVYGNEWTYQQLGSVFGITIDNNKRIYVANTDRYPNPAPPAMRQKSIYMIDGASSSAAVTVVASALTTSPAYMSQLTGEYGNLKFVSMGGAGYIYVTDFGSKKIHCLKQIAGGMLMHAYSFDPQFGSNTDGQTPYGLAIRKTSTGYRLYYARNGKGKAWTEPDNYYFGTNSNQIWAVDLNPATGAFLSSTEVQQNIPAMLEDNPFSDIAFNYDFTKMLCAQQGVTNGSQAASGYGTNTAGAHQSRVYEYREVTPNSNNWIENGPPNKFQSGNNSLTGPSSYANSKNSAGGVTYSNNILGKNNEFTCDTSVWMTSDIIYHGGISGGAAPSPQSSLTLVYGIQAMNISGGNISNAINFDLDNNYIVSGKSKVGDIEMLNDIACPVTPPACDCGDWGSIGFTLNNKSDKFLCDQGTVKIIDANKGDIFTLLPNYNCTGSNPAQPCNAIIKYDVYFPNGGVLLNLNEITNKVLDSCGDIRIVMKPTCAGKACPPCEFIIRVNCCACEQTLHPVLIWDSRVGAEFPCGSTYTDQLVCFKPYSIKVQNPCGENCQPDSIITKITYPGGAVVTSYSLAGTTLIANLVGTYTISLKVKCNGKWCKECILKFVQTKKCEPPCDNCKINGQEKVKAGFNPSNPPTSYTVGTFPAPTTLNAGFFLGGGTDTYTQIRANIVDIQVTSDNPACLQCYNTPNQWGSITAGNLNGLNGVPTAGSAHQANANNNPREIVFNPTAPVTIPMMTPMMLNLQLPGVNPLSCCCIHITVFVKITFRNNKCEECSKIINIEFDECGPNGNQSPNLQFGGHPQYRQHAPSNEDVKLMTEIKTETKKN